MKCKRRTKILLGFLVTVAVIYQIPQPSNSRDWAKDQKVLSTAVIEDDTVQISNIRNFNYRTMSDYDIAYYDKEFNLNKIESLWYIVEPFSDWKGAAHTFLSFGFTNGEYVAISVEIRKEVGEEFSTWKGLLKQYEIMYVIGDERDLVKLRSNYRKDDVYLYPVKASPEKIQELFVSMLEKASELYENPQFYNTATNTCTSAIASHINQISTKRIPFSYKVLLPGYSDELAYDLDLIDTTLSFEEARSFYKINDRAMRYADDPNFSRRIREFGADRN